MKLRNGWYNEIFSDNLQEVLQSNVVASAARDGKLSTASRSDYAQAAANVLTSPETHVGKIYELAGDTAFNLQEYAHIVAMQTQKDIQFISLSTEDFSQVLVSHGLPKDFADVVADSDRHARDGWLLDENKDLSKLIGHATTISQSVEAALAG